MYVPQHFAFEDREEILRFARQYSFATLVSTDGSMPYATHLPLIVREEGQRVVIEGHVARANPHADMLQSGSHLVIFQGPHAYISPTWYRDPGVPTWNYVAVHMSGSSSPVDDPGELAELVDHLAGLHESANPDPWKPRYAPAMLRAIRGFRLQVDTIEGKRKLSQNRSAEDRAAVIAALGRPFGRDPDDAESGTRTLMTDESER